MSKTVDTRRLYMYERKILQNSWARIMPISHLRGLAWKIWREEGRDKRRFPYIVSGKGIWYLGQWFSYCDLNYHPAIIMLTASQCRKPVLIHELVHAMGYETHGRSFVRRYFELLARYAGYHPAHLILNAGWFNIKV